MAKSKLLKELVNNEVSLLQAMDRLYLIAYSLHDDDICAWIKKEKSGYDSNDNIPPFRKTTVIPIGTYQIHSAGKIETYNDTPLPTHGVPDDVKKQFDNWYVRDSVVSLEKQTELANEGHRAGFPLDPICFRWFEKGTNILMRKAMLCISPLSIETILCSVKMAVIDLLLLYESNFGELDNLDIDLQEHKTEEINEIKTISKSIINGSFNGKTKIVIKNSNLGQGNSINKEANISVTATVEKKEKKPFFKWLRSIFRKK